MSCTQFRDDVNSQISDLALLVCFRISSFALNLHMDFVWRFPDEVSPLGYSVQLVVASYFFVDIHTMACYIIFDISSVFQWSHSYIYYWRVDEISQ